MNLPSKDKNGNSFLSYSQISTFIKDKNEYYKRYILKEPFIDNPYTIFGNKVDNAISTNNYSLFENSEIITLKKITRLDNFQRKTILNYNDFYIIGFIDSCDNNLETIIDYKTGGKNKHLEYLKDDYVQLCYYALSIKQETGNFPKNAYVEFIQRDGNAFKGEYLKVSDVEPIKIKIDISENRCKNVYWKTIEIANQISEFYKSTL